MLGTFIGLNLTHGMNDTVNPLPPPVLTLFCLLSQDIRRGLQSIKKICRDHGIGGVHGPICELVDCDEKFYTAVEVTAGNRFHFLTSDVLFNS